MVSNASPRTFKPRTDPPWSPAGSQLPFSAAANVILQSVQVGGQAGSQLQARPRTGPFKLSRPVSSYHPCHSCRDWHAPTWKGPAYWLPGSMLESRFCL